MPPVRHVFAGVVIGVQTFRPPPGPQARAGTGRIVTQAQFVIERR